MKYLLTARLLLMSCQILHIRAGESCSSNYSDPFSVALAKFEEYVLRKSCKLTSASEYVADYTPSTENVTEVDFVIVGVGTSGCVLANRLSQVANWTILAIDAGGSPQKTHQVPSYFYSCKNDSVWEFHTNGSEDSCLGSKNGKCRWPQGKVLGGTSNTNFYSYTRGHQKDYERWEDAGCEGWGYEHLLPYFKKHEKMQATEVIGTKNFYKYHNDSGELPILSWNNSQYKPIIRVFEKSAKELGFESNPDCNGANYTGFVTLQSPLKDGKRVSAESAFLKPVLNRSNLFISRHTTVHKILIKNGTAYGINFTKNGNVSQILVRKEVIVSAGSINTAKLLLLSGLGPKEHLEKHGIETVANLTVGQNLQDHPMTLIGIFKHNHHLESSDDNQAIFEFLMGKNGSRLSHHGTATNTFLFNTNKWTDDYPNVQIYLFSFHKRDSKLLKHLNYFNFNNTIIERVVEHNLYKHIILVAASLLRPHSKGSVQLVSSNYLHNPNIHCGYYSDKRDYAVIFKVYYFLKKLANTTSLQKFNVTYTQINIDECSEYEQGSKESLKCHVKHLTTTSIDSTVSSTCKMGPADCSSSVVDSSNLKVKGIERIRIADASVMPMSTVGTTTATVFVVAEKCAALIKKSYNESSS